MLTLQDITNRIKVIESKTDDPELVRILEQELREDFINHVAEQTEHSELSLMAKLVLTTNEIDCPRY